jgi:O-antigen ligase
MSRPILWLAALLLLLAPFGEGGRTPTSLFVLHSLAIVFCAVASLSRSSSGPRRAPGARPAARLLILCALIGIGAAAISAANAGYSFAAGLGLLDRGVVAGLLIASICSSPRPDDGRALRNVLAASTSLQAAVALARSLSGGAAAAGAMFLNPNHLAAWLNIGLFCCAAALARAGERRGAAPLWGGLVLLHLAAIVALQSRGAYVGLIGGALLLVGMRYRSWGGPGRRVAVAALALALAAGGAGIALRFARAEDPFRYHRLSIWRASAAMIADAPLSGHGPAMFRHVAPAYNFALPEGPVRYGRGFQGAHSSLLTLAAEDGLPAAAVALVGTLLAIVLLLRRAGGTEVDGVAEGAAVSLVALLLHGLVEDLLERPAIGIVMALLVGTVAGTRSIGGFPPGIPAPRPADGTSRILPPFGTSVVTLAIVFWGTCVLSPYLAHREATAAARGGAAAAISRMERAARLNPYQPEYQHDLAMAAINREGADAGAYAEAMERLQRARALKPIDPRFPLLMARIEARLGGALFDDPMAARRAEALYGEAVDLAPLDPRPRLEQAGHLVYLGRESEALASLRKALALEPNFRRARLLEVEILLRQDRPEETSLALEALRATDARLDGYRPDSGYAADLTRDAPRERERILGAFPTRGTPRGLVEPVELQ